VKGSKGYLVWCIDDHPYGSVDWVRLTDGTNFRCEGDSDDESGERDRSNIPDCVDSSYKHLFDYIGGEAYLKQLAGKGTKFSVPASILIKESCP
jgi:hypothetical protein